MIVCFSCSSPVSSVAIIAENGAVLFAAAQETSQNASGASLEMLETGLKGLGVRLAEASLFAADVGPGSFIGSRVGVTLAKTFALCCGVRAAGATAFDLIDANAPVAIPSRKGEFFVRIPEQSPYQTKEVPAGCVGYGTGFTEQRYPTASNFASLLKELKAMRPEELLPEYFIPPSISTPKKPFPQQGGSHG